MVALLTSRDSDGGVVRQRVARLTSDEGTTTLYEAEDGSWDLAADGLGQLYTLSRSGLVRIPSAGDASTVAADGVVLAVAADAEGNVYTLSDVEGQQMIKQLSADGQESLLASTSGSGRVSLPEGRYNSIAVATDGGELYVVAAQQANLIRIDLR